jgi:hypothetical protein
MKKKTVEFDENWAAELIDGGLMSPEGVKELERLIKQAIETDDNEPDETVH